MTKNLYLFSLAIVIFFIDIFFKTAVAGPPASFIDVAAIDQTIIMEIRYSTNHNFIGRPIAGYKVGKCFLTQQAAQAILKVSAYVKQRGYVLKLYDCYRPQMAVNDFINWVKQSAATKMKQAFYVEVPKSELFRLGYIAEKSGHSRGSTVDVTLVKQGTHRQSKMVEMVDCREPYARRYPDSSIDMGTGYDCFSELSHTLNPKVSERARVNRLRLKATMEMFGFTNYAKEWWHYTLLAEPFPKRYFNFMVE